MQTDSNYAVKTICVGEKF